MTLADRTCDACGGFVSWHDAKVLAGRCLCRKCAGAGGADAPQEGGRDPMAPATCKQPGCSRHVTTAKPSLGLCYRHLKNHPDAPPSMRPKGRPSPPRKAGSRSAPRPLKPPAPAAAGAQHCDHCGQAIPDRVLQAAGILQQNGVKRAVAIKAAALVLQAAGPPAGS